MIEFITIFLITSVLFYLLNVFCLNKNIFIDSLNKLNHKSFANKINVPITGGFLIIFTIIFLFKDITFLNKIFFISIFILGLLSDTNKLTSPKVRFYFQLMIVIVYIFLNNTYVNEIRIDYFDDYILENLIFKIIFTTFCILILINGSNFMDGVNTLNSGYFFIIFLNIFFQSFNNEIVIEIYNLKVILLTLFIFLISNIFSKSFMGDNGSYLLSFYAAIFFINFSNQNELISPYYIVVLLWYPAFENLFTLSRRLIFDKKKIKNADNFHLHHLLFLFFKKKFSNSKFINSLTGFTINLFNIFIVIISNYYLYKTKPLILILGFAVITYITMYYLLKKNIN